MSKRSTWTPEARERENELRNARRAAKAREANPNLPPYEPKLPRGPSGSPPVPHLAPGLELAGQSIFTNAQGETSRWDLGRRHGEKPAPIPEAFVPTRISVNTRGDGSETSRWTAFNIEEADRHQALMDAWDRHAERHAGLVAAAPEPARTSSDLLCLYPIGDHHLGLLAWAPETGEHWDHRHAMASLVAAVDELVRMAPDADRAILANLGDFLHAQDDAAVTPGHGNKLDVDGRHAKIADAALVLLTTCIDALLRKHRHVTVRNLPGNHDPRVAASLARELRAWYRNEPRIDIADANRAHQYDRFGNVLLGYHHGDRTPMAELPAIMSVDERSAWGECEFCHWHVGHVHHKIGFKEHPGCTVEAHRILPPGDAWHMGRYRAGRGMSVLTYDREHGEVARATVGIGRIRATIDAAVA